VCAVICGGGAALNARIPFYRYLRFCPDGRVMSLDVVDTPQEVIHNLRSVQRADFKYNNLGVGRYEQLPDAVYVRCPQRLKSHPNMKETEKRARLLYPFPGTTVHFELSCRSLLLVPGRYTTHCIPRGGAGSTRRLRLCI
jgi:hypothetical protein